MKGIFKYIAFIHSQEGGLPRSEMIKRILELKKRWLEEMGEERKAEMHRNIKEVTQRKCAKMIEKGLIHGASKLIEIAGIDPNFEALSQVVQSAYMELFEKILSGEITKSMEKMKKLYEMTEIVPDLDEERVQVGYEKLLDWEMLSYFDIFRELTKVEPRDYLLIRLEELREKREKLLNDFFHSPK